jgi:hypothetical protein
VAHSKAQLYSTHALTTQGASFTRTDFAPKKKSNQTQASYHWRPPELTASLDLLT